MLNIIVALSAANLLLACGGQNSTSIDDPPAGNSLQTTTSSNVVKTGVITGFGSIYIDGQRYATDNSYFTVNGQSEASIDALSVGMKVTMVINGNGSESS